MFSKVKTTAIGASLCAVAIGLAGVGQAVAAPPVEALKDEQPIATANVGGFPNYRIPAIIQLENGDVLISYDGRPTGTDSPGPNSILQRRSTDGGNTWAEQTYIHQGKTERPIEGYSDPSYVYDEEAGRLFNFHVFSKDTGFWNSAVGNDDADRNVMSAEVSMSEDNGNTWTHKLITKIVKPAEVRAEFATSGHGIQIKNGPYKGRLVQQFAGKFVDNSVRAYSVYSDDHGETWHMGQPVGTRMDENKVVNFPMAA
ncbi:MAG TPA: exo-alpha-sialidase [Actinomyces sp.]|nr:exo-alpha-sialidase [Actinomyces sp.]